MSALFADFVFCSAAALRVVWTVWPFIFPWSICSLILTTTVPDLMSEIKVSVCFERHFH